MIPARSQCAQARCRLASALLTAEIDAGSDELDDAVLTFLALADTGREREGISAALAALAPHLARYRRSVATYARLLVEPEDRFLTRTDVAAAPGGTGACTAGSWQVPTMARGKNGWRGARRTWP